MENYIDFFEQEIKKEEQKHIEAAHAVQDYIAGSTAIYHGEPIKTLYVPKIFSEEAYQAMKQAGTTAYRILETVTQEYLQNPEYRKLFPYPDGLEELVLYDRGYERMIPVCRLDIFFQEEDFSFKFCEINTDGTSGMVEDLELNRALERNAAFQKYKETHSCRSFELYDSFVGPFLHIYEDWMQKKNGTAGTKPYVAITDFLDGAYISDFYHFKDAFEKSGCECEIAEITELSYKNGKLISPAGHVIDAVYRRAVTTDIFSNRTKIVPFLQALKEGTVCCIGSFCTQVAHNKALFKIIRDEASLKLLTPEEAEFVLEHFPFTGYLNAKSTGTELSLQDVIDSKDRWILKPLDLYGAREISVGSDLTQAEWEAKVRQLSDRGYIFQEYCYPYKSRNVILEEGVTEFSEWINMTGLYMYDGKLAGFFSRLAPDKVIAGHYGGRTLATLVEE